VPVVRGRQPGSSLRRRPTALSWIPRRVRAERLPRSPPWRAWAIQPRMRGSGRWLVFSPVGTQPAAGIARGWKPRAERDKPLRGWILQRAGLPVPQGRSGTTPTGHRFQPPKGAFLFQPDALASGHGACPSAARHCEPARKAGEAISSSQLRGLPAGIPLMVVRDGPHVGDLHRPGGADNLHLTG